MRKVVEINLNRGQVHCPICAWNVPADVDLRGKRARVASGQKCPRCASSLDVAVVIQIPEAA
jgi:NAD-dependent SIR2 family protein deacetylase